MLMERVRHALLFAVVLFISPSLATLSIPAVVKAPAAAVKAPAAVVTTPVPVQAPAPVKAPTAAIAPAVVIAPTAVMAPAESTTIAPAPPHIVRPHECGDIDIRNDCGYLNKLDGCTVVRGYVLVVLIKQENCLFSNYSFPLLREITDYLILYDLKNLMSTRNLFPNLTVIRGQRLFLNYALGVSKAPELDALEFPSLVGVQRGHIFVGPSPKLCYTNLVDWNSLTHSVGENHIFTNDTLECNTKVATSLAKAPTTTSNICPADCNPKNCWSTQVCQRFEKDNLVNLGYKNCDPQCFGGCYNETSYGCVVCKELTDHGNCVQKCPSTKFLQEHFRRCYTRDECIHQLGYLTHRGSCVPDCPSGYIVDLSEQACIPCPAGDECIKICQPPHSGAIFIFTLADADQYRDCHTLNGSMMISIRNKINEEELTKRLSRLEVINGHLKVSQSTHLTSLKFLQNLRRIVGQPLENNTFSLIIYGNPRLQQLWYAAHELELTHGSLYVHNNYELCNRHLRTFINSLRHDNTNDSVQGSDQEALCEPTNLQLRVEVLSTQSLRLYWPRDQTAEQVKIMWRRIPPGSAFLERSALDSDVCRRIYWQQRLIFRRELQSQKNATFFTYFVDGLQANMPYAIVMKTFGEDGNNITLNATSMEARSPVIRITTPADIPGLPLIAVTHKTDTTLTLRLQPPSNSGSGTITHYELAVYEQPDDQSLLDRRNFCNSPMTYFASNLLETYVRTPHHEDYDACCVAHEEAREDQEFISGIAEDFPCTTLSPKNCQGQTKPPAPSPLNASPIKIERVEGNTTTTTLSQLTRFRAYMLQLRACDKENGCGRYAMLSARTNFSQVADRLEDLSACRVADTGEYHVYFSEPAHPNGAIVAYAVHLAALLPSPERETAEQAAATAANKTYYFRAQCLTRLQHEQAKFELVWRNNDSTQFTQVFVRIISLATNRLSNSVNVSICRGSGPGVGPTTRLAGFGLGSGRPGHGLNLFFVCFLLGACGTLVWLCYKRQYWRKLPQLRRHLPTMAVNWRSLLLSPRRHFDAASGASMEDRQILVDDFETVRFHNDSDDEHKYLE